MAVSPAAAHWQMLHAMALAAPGPTDVSMSQAGARVHGRCMPAARAAFCVDGVLQR